MNNRTLRDNDKPDGCQNCAVLRARAEKAELEVVKWRDEAFRQYPTPEAYGAVCIALEKHKVQIRDMEAELAKLRPVMEAAEAYHQHFHPHTTEAFADSTRSVELLDNLFAAVEKARGK